MISASRRKFIQRTIVAASAVSVIPQSFISCSEKDDPGPDTPKFEPEGPYGFFEGVASFDPTASSVILWSRYTKATNEPSNPVVALDVSISDDFAEVIVSEQLEVNENSDFTVNVEITGLTTNTKYYYRFRNEATGAISAIGETKTLPVQGDASSIHLAVVSCSNYEIGYFNVYEAIAESDADLVIHLGDYIYEGFRTNFFTGRAHDPPNELIDIDDYRTRYRQYRNDLQLQKAHQLKPFICVWDDHEFSNDAYQGGASNHQDNEGDFVARKNTAMQAWHEYLPCRTDNNAKIFRNFDIGGFVNLMMLDTRIYGREKQLSYRDYLINDQVDQSFVADWKNANRTILGAEQKTWLIDQIKSSNSRWQVIGNQVLMGKHYLPAELIPIMLEVLAGTLSTEKAAEYYQLVSELIDIKNRIAEGDQSVSQEERFRIENTLPYNLDSWDGYPAEREEILAAAASKSLISIAGDSHNAWHNELKSESKAKVGEELATASITSSGLEGIFGVNAALITLLEQANVLLMDDVKYSNASKRGYLFATFTESQVRAEFRFATTISSIDSKTTTGKTVEIY